MIGAKMIGDKLLSNQKTLPALISISGLYQKGSKHLCMYMCQIVRVLCEGVRAPRVYKPCVEAVCLEYTCCLPAPAPARTVGHWARFQGFSFCATLSSRVVASRFNPCNLPFGTAKVQSSRVRGPIVFGWSLLPKGYSKSGLTVFQKESNLGPNLGQASKAGIPSVLPLRKMSAISEIRKGVDRRLFLLFW